jgi:N-acetylneuraminic acid mutarotase
MLDNLGRIARYDTAALTWNGLPNQGLDNAVYALVAADDDLYVGGTFTATGDGTLTELNRIARYDTELAWHALNNHGVNGYVRALAVVGGDLYVGGSFSWSGDGTVTNLGYIARYDTTGEAWHALPNQGLNGYVYALGVVGDDLYVGGEFTSTGDGTVTDLNCIARYDTMGGTWNTLPNDGLSSTAFALAVVGDDLYVGGSFAQAGDGTLTNLVRIARYDTTGGTWHALPNKGLNGTVLALAVVGSDLYVGGNFTTSGDTTVTDLNRIARYDTAGGAWHALSKQGLSSSVLALAVVGGDLYVGGVFTATGDGTVTNLGYIVRYDTAGGTWHALPNGGLDDDVRALAVVGDNLYVGGAFGTTGDGAVTNLGGIARYSLHRHWVYLPLVIRQ